MEALSSSLYGSFIFLFLENYGVRKLEAVFALLIATMAFSFAWMFGETKPSGKELLMGKHLTAITICIFTFNYCCTFLIHSSKTLVDPFFVR